MMTETEMFELADRLKILKDEKKQAELELKDLNDKIFQIDKELSELMIINETQNFTRNGTTFCLISSIKASPISGIKDELYEKLREKGFGNLIYETINANSLSSFVKEQIADNEDVVPEWLEGLINIFEKTTIGVRKSIK